MTTTDKSHEMEISEELDNIGEEFCCARSSPEEPNEVYAPRIIDELEAMIAELRNCQARVRALSA